MARGRQNQRANGARQEKRQREQGDSQRQNRQRIGQTQAERKSEDVGQRQGRDPVQQSPRQNPTQPDHGRAGGSAAFVATPQPQGQQGRSEQHEHHRRGRVRRVPGLANLHREVRRKLHEARGNELVELGFRFEKHPARGGAFLPCAEAAGLRCASGFDSYPHLADAPAVQSDHQGGQMQPALDPASVARQQLAAGPGPGALALPVAWQHLPSENI